MRAPRRRPRRPREARAQHRARAGGRAGRGRRAGLRPPRLGGAAQPRPTRRPTRRWPPASTTAPSPRLDLWRLYLQGFQARSQLDQGRWTEAAETASVVLGDARTSSIPRIHAGVVLGLVRARRGDPGSAGRPRRARCALAELSEELQCIEAVAAARRRGRLAARRPRRRRRRRPRPPSRWRPSSAPSGVVGELALWRRRAGLSEEIAGRRRRALRRCSSPATGRRRPQRWTAIGRPYEAALALADGDGDARRRALDRAARARRRARRRRSSPAACALAARAGCGAARGARRATTPRT